MYYAAFGIFTSGYTMQSLVGNARLVGRGEVKGFRFEWRGCADIERDPKSNLYVVVWDIDQTMLTRLDRIEGYPIGYDRIDVSIHLLSERENVDGKVYTMPVKGPLEPPGDSMFRTVYAGHAEHSLPRGQVLKAYRRANIKGLCHERQDA